MGFLRRLLRIALPVALIAAPFLIGAAVAAGATAAGTAALAAGGTSLAAAGAAAAAFVPTGLLGVASAAVGALGGGGSAFSTVLRIGGTALNVFGQFQQGRAQADYFTAQQNIAALNAQQIRDLLPLQEEAFEEEIVSIGEARDIRIRDISERRDRANRQGEFTFEGLERAEELNILSEAGIRERSTLASRLVTSQLGIIVSRATEKTRQIDVEQGRIQGAVSQIAARGGTRVGGGSAETLRGEVRLEAGKATEEVRRERDQALTQTTLADEARLSQEREQISTLDIRTAELEQQRRETQQGLTDALFDASIELEINKRNAEIAIKRAEFNKKLARKRAEIAGLQADIEGAAAGAAARDAETAALIGGAQALFEFPF